MNWVCTLFPRRQKLVCVTAGQAQKRASGPGICFTVATSYVRGSRCEPMLGGAGFAQWKDMLQLLLACEEAPLRSHTALYVHFLTALRMQLQHSLGSVRSLLHAMVAVLGGAHSTCCFRCTLARKWRKWVAVDRFALLCRILWRPRKSMRPSTT